MLQKVNQSFIQKYCDPKLEEILTSIIFVSVST